MKRRMINCTTTAVENLYEKRDWRLIFHNLRNIRIPTDIPGMPLDYDEWVCDHPETVWETIATEGIIEIHASDPFLSDIQNRPNMIMDYPKDIFLIDQKTKRKMSKNTGVIMMSDKSARATSLKCSWPGKLQHDTPFNWKSFFNDNGRDMSTIPNNALVITDLYLFDQYWKQGIRNLSCMLEEILPESFEFDYHILIVTDVACQRKPIDTHIAVREIQKILDNLRRSYPIVFEVLFIEKIDGKPQTEEEEALCTLYSASHNRRIYSNSFIIYAEHGYNTVINRSGDNRARWDQKVEFQCIYHGVDNKQLNNEDLPVNFIDDYLEKISVIIDKSLNVGNYFINGKEGKSQDIINRLVRR